MTRVDRHFDSSEMIHRAECLLSSTAGSVKKNEVTARASRDYVSCPTILRLVVSLLLCLFVGAISAWGQTDDYSGTYYINTSTSYYLVPGLNCYYNDSEDKPHLTTYQTNKDNNSLWRVEKSGSYYHIIHNATGKYLTANDAKGGSYSDQHLRVHLETAETPNEDMLFEILPSGTNFVIRSTTKSATVSGKSYSYLSTTSGDKNIYYPENNVATGMVEFNNDAVSSAKKWTFIPATPTCATPVITYNESTAKFNISYPIASDAGISIYYTTDGSAPKTSETRKLYSGDFAETGVKMVRAIAVKDGYDDSEVAELYSPIQPYLFKTTVETDESYYMIDDTNETSVNNVTLSNVPNERMAWLLKSAGLHSGIQYYYFVNKATGKYLYCLKDRGNGSAFAMKALDEEGTTHERYVFRLWQADGYFNILPKPFAYFVPTTSSNNCLRKGNKADHTDPLELKAENAYARWISIPVPEDPRTLSVHEMALTAEGGQFFKLKCANAQTYFIYPPTTVTGSATAAASGLNPEWGLIKADDNDNWCTYYYLRNATTGYYLYFDGVENAENSGKFLIAKDLPESSADKFKFLVVKTARTDNNPDTYTYHIIPKTLKDYPNQVKIALAKNGNSSALLTGNSRNNKNACWYFEAVDMALSQPVITYNATDNTVSLSCVTPNVSFRYTTDGTDPTSSNGTVYNGTAFPLPDNCSMVKAIALRGSSSSSVATYYAYVHATTDGNKRVHYIQSVQNGNFYLIPGHTDKGITYVNTTSLFRPSMQWYFLDAGMVDDVQYYYIVNYSTGEYLYRNGNNANMKSAADFDGSDDYKFAVVQHNVNDLSTGLKIVPKNQQSNSLQKSGNGIHNDTGIMVTNGGKDNAQAHWNILITKPTMPEMPFTATVDGQASYYQIGSVSANTYVIVSGTNATTTTNKSDVNTHWYIREAASDDWLPYYYIVNAQTGQYLYFCKENKTDNQAKAFELRDAPMIPTDRYLFAFAPTATDGQWYIVPKPLRYLSNNNFTSLRRENTDPLKTYIGRSNQYWWTFTKTETFKCATPTFSYDENTGLMTINCVSAEANIYYSTSGDPTISNETLYTGPFKLTSGSVKAISARSSKGSDASTPATSETITGFKCATPTFSYDAVSGIMTINCATPDVNIYYTINVEGEPTVNSTNLYSGPFKVNNGVKNVIRAIATADDAGSNKSDLATSDALQIFKCATPVITFSSKERKIGITCATEGATIYYSTNGSTPTTPYTGSFSVDENTTVKAIAKRGEGADSDEATYSNAPKLISNWDNYDLAGNYILADGFTAPSKPIGTEDHPFTGTIDGGFSTIESLTHPLVGYAKNATIKNVILKDVEIDESGNVGAICSNAIGDSRIYNCGILGKTWEEDEIVKDENGVVVNDENGNPKTKKVTKYSSTVKGDAYTGGIVGLLDGTSRVINCFSYATIARGTSVGGIVGYNSYESKATDIRTMVMNCMFYGDITGGTTVSPVYGGNNINNQKDKNGLNTFNYYSYENLKTKAISSGKYNCALAVEEKYLNRFELYRMLLNSNKKLAAIYASTTTTIVNPSEIAKWVIETADKSISAPMPYPVLKPQGRYPSIINYDVDNAETIDADNEHRNEGRKLGKTLTVYISNSKSAGGQSWPAAARITTNTLTLERTDKDFASYNYNYDKIQLPYYNDVGLGNYTGNRVVTGWKITSVTGGTPGAFVASDDWGGYNFADRQCTIKDQYSASQRVFSQGAYYDVPYGATSITIEPYWAKCAYIADPNYDVVYKSDYGEKTNVTQTGTQVAVGTTMFHDQRIETTMDNALNYINNTLGGYGPTVYDNAVVLVGNLHLNGVPSGGSTPFTMMSADDDNDHEPDCSLIYHHSGRTQICPIRFDFLNIPGTAQAQKPNGAGNIMNMTIVKTKGWFEITNTALTYFTQFEYENLDNSTKVNAPLILQGGIIDQFVSTQSSAVNGNTIYIHVGGNVWIHNFGMGTHSDGSKATPHVPVSVTGGDFDGFYLTGTYNANADVSSDNAECYISGGHFTEVAGGSQEKIDGNVHWQIYNADIDEFFGGGTNDAKPITGTVITDIYNSHVNLFCGGPKFGNMTAGKAVTTNAEGCTFNNFFGAGYGGNSYSRKKYFDATSYDFTNQQKYYYNPNSTTAHENEKGKYYDGVQTSCPDAKYGKKGAGVAADFDYEFFVWSSGQTGARFFVKFVSFSLAQCHDVNSTLTGCIINQNFYGGGNLGKVTGTCTSVLNRCTVKGNAFGAGYSATLPTIPIRDAGFANSDSGYLIPKFNSSSGMFEPGTLSGTTEYTWKHVDNYPSEGEDGFDGTQVITTQNIEKNNLGSVGSVSFTIKGNSIIGTVGDATTGNVYGGGDESAVSGNTIITMQDGTQVTGDVYGGGNVANVDGATKVILLGGMVNGDVYGGGKGRLSGTKDEKGTELPEVKATVGDATVLLNGMEAADYDAEAYGSLNLAHDDKEKAPYTVADNQKGCVVKGNIFGCNNLNGTPLGIATVHVYATQRDGQSQIVKSEATPKAKEDGTKEDGEYLLNTFDVKAVYGGGNLAAYEPTNAFLDKEVEANKKLIASARTNVIIDGCDRTSIGQVYGGGNAASTPGTNVVVYGTYEIGELFGGGNGKDDLPDGSANPGANVGYKAYPMEMDPPASSKEERYTGYGYGSGVAAVNIYGGKIHTVFGGSNTKGNVCETAVTLLDDQSSCDYFDIDEAYGGGKSAPMDAESRLLMACIPGLKEVYGGAEAADIQGNVTLTVTNGNFQRVFGGNNISGTIHGSIVVNVEETGCHPVIIGQLYGGGNQAPYTAPFKKDAEGNETTEREDGPTVNVKAFTSIGDIYGGGYGMTAKVVGDTHVNINVCEGDKTWATTDDKHWDEAVEKIADKTGVKTFTVTEFERTTDITEENPNGFVYDTDDNGNKVRKTNEVSIPVTLPFTSGQRIGAIYNVFGGGNAAEVDGNTNVKIGTKPSEPFASDGSTRQVKGADIRGNVYGGGNQAEVTGSTNVVIGKKAAE